MSQTYVLLIKYHCLLVVALTLSQFDVVILVAIIVFLQNRELLLFVWQEEILNVERSIFQI